MGQRLGLKAWYCDSTYRYTMTDNLQPLIVRASRCSARRATPRPTVHATSCSPTAATWWIRPASWAARSRRSRRAWWSASAPTAGLSPWHFADGSVGHLDLVVAVRGDWEEGFQIYGEHGSVKGKVYLPWFHKAAEVECFSTRDGQYRRVLGADAYTYKLQIEGFAATILDGAPMRGATVADGVESVRALVAIAQSVRSGGWVQLDSVRDQV